MATTFEGTQLTEMHRKAQLALRALTLSQLLALWRAFDERHIDESWATIEDAVMAIITQRRENSAQIALGYAELFRIAEGVLGPPPVAVAPPPAAVWVPPAVVSLRVTGPVAAKQLVAQNATGVAEKALVRISGAASRIVLGGGRGALQDYVRRDSRSLGWARVTDDNPCYFCAMLASRGPVYHTDANFEVHDHDACTLEPVYRQSTQWPGKAREFKQLWQESTADAPAHEKDAQLAFRKAYETR